MNIRNDNEQHDEPNAGPLSDALRWQLRALRKDVDPPHDLWSGIAARLPTQTQARVRRPAAWLKPLAMAASLLLVVGTVGWFARPTPTDRSADPAAPTLVQREAEGLTRQYQAALQEMPAPMPASLKATAEQLDRDAALIRDALAHDPDSVRLLDQLRRTYAYRLALAQRVAYT